MASSALSDDPAGGDVQCSEEGRRSVANVRMGSEFGPAAHHRKRRLHSVERLDLRFLVHAKDDGALRWVEVQADDVSDLLDEERVVGQLERLRAVRLESEGSPDSADCRMAQPGMLRHVASTPVRRTLGCRLQRLDDDTLDRLVGDRPWSSGPGLIMETLEPQFMEPVSPSPNGPAADLHLCCDSGVLTTLRATEDDPGPQGERLRGRPPPRITLEHLSFFIGDLGRVPLVCWLPCLSGSHRSDGRALLTRGTRSGRPRHSGQGGRVRGPGRS